MWRCIFAIAHVDDVVSPAERVLMLRILQDNPFSEEQRRILLDDIDTRQDVISLFARITDQSDRSLFFKKARDLVWADGDYGAAEQKIILDLKRAHVLSSDFDTVEFEGSIELETPITPEFTPQPPEGTLQKPGLIARILSLIGLGKD
jgi:hypothetical protein